MAIHSVVWSEKATHELKNILDYYNKRNKSTAYSKKLLNKIRREVKLISTNPLLGIKTNIPNIRTLIFDNYQIIYEVMEDNIIISMIWDSRRNPENYFKF